MQNNQFIGIDKNSQCPYQSSSLFFRREFFIKNKNGKYFLNIIGLGSGVYYLNGKKISKAILLQSPSNYDKTLWMHRFDVTKYVQEGKNVLAVELGNGFFNESIETTWHIEKAFWRKNKCLLLSFYNDKKLLFESDEKFLVKYSLFRTFNELRSGESVDFNYLENFYDLDYDDSNWEKAVFVDYPLGKIRKLNCPLIKEFENYKPIKIIKKPNSIIYDFGHNISGYCRVNFSLPKGRTLILKHSEDINENNDLELHGLNCYHINCPFQEIKIICDGNTHTFKPSFAYFGFRYVEVIGLKENETIELTSIFIHQDLKLIHHPDIKDRNIKKLYEAVIRSTYSNTYYMFTDCPTREKLGWLNDLQASLNQIFYNFDVRKFFKKYYQDVIDGMDKSGNMPGIIPSHNWGYDYGPLCGSLIGSLPYLYYQNYHDSSLYRKGIKYIKRYLSNIEKHVLESYLGDWTGCSNHPHTPQIFTITTYRYILSYIIYFYYKNINPHEKFANLYNSKMKKYSEELIDIYNNFENACDSQCLNSVMLTLHLGDKKACLKHLLQAIENANYHINCGMFATQFVYRALKENGYQDYIYKMAFNDSNPSFKCWLNADHDTLPETFNNTWSLSMNHHMYSGIIMYLL